MKTFKILSIAVLGSMIALTSCKKDTEEATQPEPAKNQSMKVRMTDNPGNYAGLDVEITSIQVMNESNQWLTLENDAQTVSVLKLTNGAEKELAFENEFSTGVYTKLKFVFSSNNELELNSAANGGGGSSTLNLGLEVGSTQEVIVDIDERVDASTGANILVDFNVAESVIDLGTSYVLNPQLTVITDPSTGVQGSVSGETRAALMFKHSNDSSLKFSAYTNNDGEFLVRGMQNGTYTLTVMPDQDEDASLNNEYEIQTVAVANGEITQMGTIVLQ